MILAGNQPYFLPYFPYWQLIAAADCFVVSDDYQFIKGGWVNRNRILVGGRPQLFQVELKHAHYSKLISEREVLPIHPHKLKTLEMAYHKAPFFKEGYALAERILSCPETNLAAFLNASIHTVCEYLGITTRLVLSSGLEGNSLLKKEYRAYDFCHRLGADHFVNAIGGQALYSKEAFRAEGIELSFIQTTAGPYDQGGIPFVPDLSVLDAIMFNSRDELHSRLGQYRLI